MHAFDWKNLLAVLDSVEMTLGHHYVAREPVYRADHAHPDRFQLTYIVSGHTRIYHGQGEYDVGPDHAIYTPPHTRHLSTGDAETEFDMFEFLFRIGKFEDVEAFPKIQPVTHVLNVGGFVPALERLCQAYRAYGPTGWLMRIRLAEVLILLAEEASFSAVALPSDSGLARRIRQVMYHISIHYGEPLTVDGLGELAGMSGGYFATCFRDTVGISPIEYVIQTRLRQAKEMLEDTDTTIRRISERCGFASPKYFARLFHRREGLTPSAFREHARQKHT
jgi:AraC-like DNA-binding protein